MEFQCSHEKVRAVGDWWIDRLLGGAGALHTEAVVRASAGPGKKVKLPVIICSRDAAKDTLDIAKAEKAGDMGGVIHCFSYGRRLQGVPGYGVLPGDWRRVHL